MTTCEHCRASLIRDPIFLRLIPCDCAEEGHKQTKMKKGDQTNASNQTLGLLRSVLQSERRVSDSRARMALDHRDKNHTSPASEWRV